MEDENKKLPETAVIASLQIAVTVLLARDPRAVDVLKVMCLEDHPHPGFVGESELAAMRRLVLQAETVAKLPTRERQYPENESGDSP